MAFGAHKRSDKWGYKRDLNTLIAVTFPPFYWATPTHGKKKNDDAPQLRLTIFQVSSTFWT